MKLHYRIEIEGRKPIEGVGEEEAVKVMAHNRWDYKYDFPRPDGERRYIAQGIHMTITPFKEYVVKITVHKKDHEGMDIVEVVEPGQGADFASIYRRDKDGMEHWVADLSVEDRELAEKVADFLNQ